MFPKPRRYWGACQIVLGSRALSELIEVAFRFRQVFRLPAMSFQLALVHKDVHEE